MSFVPFPNNPGLANALQLLAGTPAAGFPLQNGTPTIVSWIAPNDGKLHRVLIVSQLQVTSTETGGATGINVGPASQSQFGAGAGVGSFINLWGATVIPGQTVSYVQSSALTAGASTVWAEIWGS